VNPAIVRRVFELPGRSTRAIVDFDAIAQNVASVKALVGASVHVMAVVKANAYGHGAIAVSRTALAAGADHLGVATVDEGVHLRTAGIDDPIVLLGPADESEIPLALANSLELAVGSIEFADRVSDVAGRIAVPVPVLLHLEIDTGMHRFGASLDQAVAVAEYIDASPRLRLRGAYTHFARADELDVTPTLSQLDRFDGVLRQLGEKGIRPEIVHAANSAALLHIEPSRRDLVRLGIGLYGLRPSPEVRVGQRMRPAMTLVSRVCRLVDLQAGDAVSYGATYRAQSSERIALVPIGYADGYRRNLSNCGEMMVGGLRCPVRGRVCMDQTLIGIPPRQERLAVGDPIVVGGAWDSPNAPSFEQIASWAGTINYELATGIARRVPRVFVRSGRVVAVEDLQGYRVLDA
jgi:alanine racemase